MSIELDRDQIKYSLKVQFNRHLAIWRGSHQDIAEHLADMVTEVMFDVAATSLRKGPEGGIVQGCAMIRNWED